MTRVLHTARISNVDSVMFADRNSRDGKFFSSVKNYERCFSSCNERGTKQKILSPHEESNDLCSHGVLKLLYDKFSAPNESTSERT